MRKSLFKKSFFLSLIGHITVFSLFNLSFGYKLPYFSYQEVNFWGDFLQKHDFIPQRLKSSSPLIKPLLLPIKEDLENKESK